MVQELDYSKFLLIHEAQLRSAGVPPHFWQTLYIKLKNQVFDSNETFELLSVDYGDEIRVPEDPLWVVQVKNGVNCSDKKHIYLVDHAWTFRVNTARAQLVSLPNLQTRLANITGASGVDAILNIMWKYCQTYCVGNAGSIEDRMPVWYIMDELGSGIQHSDYPNFRTVPFIYAVEQISYTLMFPIKDLECGDILMRDFCEGVTDSDRKALLIPWVPVDLSEMDFNQGEPPESYFLSGHIEESLPLNVDFKFILNSNQRIKVYSEYSLVNRYLTDPKFEIVEDALAADVLWYTSHFKNYAELSKTNKYVNQFPFENVFTIKDLLCVICRRTSAKKTDLATLETNPAWLPTTYNLKTELPKFVSYFQNRAKLNLDNHWICKPWNLARSLDTHITNNLDYILKLPTTGPKIAQKYLNTPVLFNRAIGNCKFDIRYVILLKSITPLKAYIYNNFFLRFANKPFVLSNFDDYETHFTVMNYNNEANLKHLPCAEFLDEWARQYSNFPWPDVQAGMVKMFREVFEAAVALGPPRGVAPSPQSRAVYAADVMLAWENGVMQPKLLEVNWTPDCKRACDYYPEFYNDIFQCLFLNNESNVFTCL